MSLVEAAQLVRVRQWTKNLAVFAALVFSGKLFDGDKLGAVLLAFVALNLVSGGLYALNDAIDAQRDRVHPVKRDRPVARGAISAQAAVLLGTIMLAGGIALSAVLDTWFLAIVAGYLILQLLYAAGLKNVAIVDLIVIALGFVLRAVAGAVVIHVPVSPWLILCAGLLALFLATAKRRHELVLLDVNHGDHRPVLREYSPELLDSFMTTLSAATITSYALYTFFEARTPGYTMMLTIPLVIYGVLRYQWLVLKNDRGGRPEEILLTDRPILATVGFWTLAVIVLLYVPGAV